ncbi:hypothetical protein HLPR_16000 [Helicovermis profundi]|uniref:Integrase catalytic domain-containing protein n=1 Tax=Helicovermis profundi TaxID=3065157 RepID=A0AAU9ED39_9FIRM|nr:hypothetical protein HLPR_16000 [Clostridia bacterium S502]
MCKVLKIARSTYYYEKKTIKIDSILENRIIEIFKSNRKAYGTRKIKKELSKVNMIASRKKIGKIMKKYNLISSYTIKQYKVTKSKVNEDKIENLVKREFDDKKCLEVVVSDLTYVNVNGKWNYICLILDFFNREIVGYAAGKNKTAKLVYKALTRVKEPLHNIEIFHTDRGSEFKNKLLDEVLLNFNIKRSLSKKGCPYDNAVAEATYKIIKTEFAFNRIFKSFEELELELFDYVNWYNNKRIHGSLDYLTPIEYKTIMSDKKLS